MHRSSESVAALASALAKAQTELINPEKSLIATISCGRAGDGTRSFRYAPLSSGLDIVRKTLGQHEIATVQSTAIDKETGIVRLTTMLAHASGEWIASDWPVCAIAETANPQRVGAALTYARRYALFALAGIAGEDDLDAPDLCASAIGSPDVGSTGSGAGRTTNASDIGGRLRFPARSPGNGQGRGPARTASTPALSSDESAVLRDRLLSEIAGLQSEDSATKWAGKALTAKNRLAAQDAKLLEDAFEKKFSEFLPLASDQVSTGDAGRGAPSAQQEIGMISAGHAIHQETADQADARGIDKSALAISAPRRYRNKDHLRFVTRQPCLLCGRRPSDAHHIRFVQPRALGRKASDEFTVPLCRSHHRSVHRVGDEQVWWLLAGIDPVEVARKLWNQTRTAEGRIEPEPPSIPATTSDLAKEPSRPATDTQSPI
jgi:hypothetical protein